MTTTTTITIIIIIKNRKKQKGVEWEKDKETNFAGDLQVASAPPVLLSVDIHNTDIHGPDDVLPVPPALQHVARGKGDFPVAANGIPDGVVLAWELGCLRGVGEGHDVLASSGQAHLCAGL